MSARAQFFFIAVAMLAGCGSPTAPANATDAQVDVIPDVSLADSADTTLVADAAETTSAGDTQDEGAAADGATAVADSDALTPDDTQPDATPDAVDADMLADVPPEPNADALDADSGEVAQATDTQDTDGGPFDSGDVPLATCQCGDGLCTTSCGETQATCPADCKGCGNGVCEPGEGPKSCAIDCCGSCGDGKCKGYDCGESPQACPQDCANACGNKVCDKGESPANCAEDCKWQACGNGVCEASDGGPGACPKDCAASCGNGICEGGEDFLTCPVDCGYCGDGFCVAGLDETPVTCPGDCDKNPDCDPGIPSDVTKCDDGNPCTIEQCNPVGHCKHLPTTGACEDGNVCTFGDGCQNAVCTPGAATSCDDDNPCTADSCDAILGCGHKATTAACDDGNVCTVGDVCAAGSCAGGAPKGCSDGNPCTIDSCDSTGGCFSVAADGEACNDGNLCTINDSCSGNTCAGTAKTCDDNNVCTSDVCEAGSGGCNLVPLTGGSCNDGSACTVGDSCGNGVCSGGAVACNDGAICTDDACEPATGCVFTPNTVACNDGVACTKNDSCAAYQCHGTAYGCDDGEVCTADACDGAGGCSHGPASGSCDDGDSCTVSDACVGTACHGVAKNCDDGNVCTDDACELATGCVFTPNTVACNDGVACTENDSCAAYQCHGTAYGCDDGEVCTADACDGAGGCSHGPASGSCDDGDSCTVSDACVGTACHGVVKNCDDGNVCTTDVCELSGACTPIALSVDVCDDGNPCSVGDGCVGGSCSAGTGNLDADVDGFIAAGCPSGLDCNDADPEIHPNSLEICDNADNDCSGETDQGCDDDSDGFCDTQMFTVGNPLVCNHGGGDCDDANPLVNPGVAENCNTVTDDDCNGGTNAQNAVDCKLFFFDADSDKWGTASVKCMCAAVTQFRATQTGDCNDDDASINPGATEACDGVANTCKGVDVGCDDDGDGWCDASMPMFGQPAVCTHGGGDCNDTTAAVHPSAAEACDDTDDNCNGNTDEGCNADGDGYCTGTKTTVGKPTICPKGGQDCNDQDVFIFPGATELCDGRDNACSGTTDTGCDDDKDGFCDFAMVRVPGQAQCVNGGGDCDDTSAGIEPGASEVCDDKDNDCDQAIDEGCDDDADGYCDSALPIVGSPSRCPHGGGDCDDTHASVHPGALEQCDDLDNGCSGSTDVGCDLDGDGFCSFCLYLPNGGCLLEKPLFAVVGHPASCPNGIDCDDSNVNVKGTSPPCFEHCDGIDNNLSGQTDEGCDNDKDGWCDFTMLTVGPPYPAVCTKGAGDCNDVNGAINPGAGELCDNIDNNCSGTVDEICKDNDGDGYCNGASVTPSGNCPNGGGDCDDGDSTIHPGKPEVCSTWRDENCDGSNNLGGSFFGAVLFFLDSDGDGYGTGAGQAMCYASGDLRSPYPTDCDDAAQSVHPWAVEVCDAVDDDCDAVTDELCVP